MYMHITCRNVIILLDEMKIREDLVFDRNGSVTGFVDIGKVNNDLKRLECTTDSVEEIASHMLTVMVRGVFTKLEHPIGHFSTNGIIHKCMIV